MIVNVTGPVCCTPSCNSPSSFYITTTPSLSSFYITTTPHHLPFTSQPLPHRPHGDAQVRTTIAVCVLCVYDCVISFSSAINNIFYGSHPAYICAGSGAGCTHGDVNVICKIACVVLIAPYHHCCYRQYCHQYCHTHCHHYSSGESMPLC